MKAAQRNFYISKIMDELENIGGAQFESFARHVADEIMPVPMKHRGLNPQGQPVKGTVDSVSDDGTYVAEYSSRQDYFSGKLDKIKSDIEHAYQNHRQVRVLKLFSTRKCSPAQDKEVTNLVNDMKNQYGIEDIEVWDSRRTAEYIFDELTGNDRVIGLLSNYIPCLRQLHEESLLSHMLPRIGDDYIHREEIEEEINNLLDKHICLAVVGISGCGKTDICCAVAHKRQDKHDVLVWLDASQVATINDLYSISILRSESGYNIINLLRNRSCLLILDDLCADIPIRDLIKYCGPESRILISKQNKSAADAEYELKLLSQEQSRKLLERDVATPCPDELFFEIWDKVAGHPLMLRLMNDSVRGYENPWEDLEADCRNLTFYIDNQNQPIVERLFSRVRRILEREILLLKWFNQRRVDGELIKFILTPRAAKNLEQYCLFTKEHSGILKIHDIIMTLLDRMDMDVGHYEAEFIARFKKYARKMMALRDLSFFKFAHLHIQQIEQVLRHGRDSATLYCYLHVIDAQEFNTAIVGGLEDIIGCLFQAGKRVQLDDDDTIVKTALEVIEKLYYKQRLINGRDVANDELRSRMDIYDQLLQLPTISDLTRASIIHQKAKSYLKLGEVDVAIHFFETVVNSPEALPASRLQLARLYADKGNEFAEHARDHIRAILEKEGEFPDSVAYSIVLEAFATLRRKRLQKYLQVFSEEFGDMIADYIKKAIGFGYDQPYRAFADIGVYWEYNDSDLFNKIFSSLPSLSIKSVNDINDTEIFARAEILRLAGNFYLRNNSNSAIDYYRSAINFYESLPNPNSFQLRRKAETLIRLNKFEEAQSILCSLIEKKTDRPDIWSLYWRSKAYLGLGKCDEAQKDISSAIDNLTEENSHFMSAFISQKAEIEKATGNIEAGIRELNRALACCTHARYRGAIEEKIAAWQNEAR